MPQAIILPSAQADIDEIWDYVSQDSRQNADRLVDRIYELCRERLAHQPMMGRSREELAPQLRSFPVGSYLVFYRPISDGIEVVRVLHGRRDIESLFEK